MKRTTHVSKKGYAHISSISLHVQMKFRHLIKGHRSGPDGRVAIENVLPIELDLKTKRVYFVSVLGIVVSTLQILTH